MEKRGEEKEGERGDKLKVKSNDFFSMACIGVPLPTLVLTERSVFDCLPSREFGLEFSIKLITFLQKSSSIKFLTRLLSWN